MDSSVVPAPADTDESNVETGRESGYKADDRNRNATRDSTVETNRARAPSDDHPPLIRPHSPEAVDWDGVQNNAERSSAEREDDLLSDAGWASDADFDGPVRAFRSRRGKQTLCARTGFDRDEVRDRGVSTHVRYQYQSETSNGFNLQFWGFEQVLFTSRPAQEISYGTAARQYSRYHFVVGFLSKRTGIAKEDLWYFNGNTLTHSEDLFKVLRKAIRRLRPWWKRLLSLKSLAGFSLYQCFPDHGAHVATKHSMRTETILLELYRAFRYQKRDYGHVWATWIADNLNQGDKIDHEKRFALQLVLHWSVFKIAVWGMTPVLLSLAVGLWYQTIAGDDRNAIVQTAWTISSYIIGAASVLIALLVAITQLGDT